MRADLPPEQSTVCGSSWRRLFCDVRAPARVIGFYRCSPRSQKTFPTPLHSDARNKHLRCNGIMFAARSDRMWRGSGAHSPADRRPAEGHGSAPRLQPRGANEISFKAHFPSVMRNIVRFLLFRVRSKNIRAFHGSNSVITKSLWGCFSLAS